jgi:hypothetical protein
MAHRFDNEIIFRMREVEADEDNYDPYEILFFPIQGYLLPVI